MSISQIVEANGPIFTVLFVSLSLASVAVVAWRIFRNINAKTDLEDFLGRLQQELTRGGTAGAMQLCNQEKGPIPKMFMTVLQTGHEGKVATRGALTNLIELEIIPDLNRGLPTILVFIKLAPMLGLLGTVWGMILAFGKIAGATKVEPSALANDIGMALFTTAEGLIIAIPLIFAYSLFREHVGSFERELQKAAQAGMNLVPTLTRKTP